MYVADTIAAIATPAGPGAVGIIRTSGPLSEALADRLFDAPVPPASWVSHRLYRGQLRATDGTIIDDGLGVLMRAPHSYTGEDVVELHCHGSPVVLRHVLAHLLTGGARLAEPGEFTKRAFLNGRLDLAQAEAVADLVGSTSTAGAALAAAQLGGHLSAALHRIRDDLIRLKALLEAQIDFSEEDVQIPANDLLELLEHAQDSTRRLIDTSEHGALIRSGVRIAIVGKPNVGKSSLLNALLGRDRAIVAESAGTTRDTIEEVTDFNGIPTVLTDTAGLRDEADADAVERLGMQRTTSVLRQAQVRLVVLDASRRLDDQDRAALLAVSGMICVVVFNKIDIRTTLDEHVVRSFIGAAPIVNVSATQLIGLDELRAAVVRLVEKQPAASVDGPLVASARHHAALTCAAASLVLVHSSIATKQPADLVAVDVQEALDHIGTITGTVTTEDVLDQIFREFCIGK